MAERQYIRDLQGSELVEGVFAMQNCQLGMTKNGKPFIKCMIGDKTGRTPGRMWNTSEELFHSLPTDGFVEIRGQAQPYQGEVQIIIQNICTAYPSDGDLIELLPSTSNDIDQMFEELCAIVESIEHPPLLTLVQAYLGDEELIENFRRAPAAMTLHHAYLGGLLEHTLSLLKLAEVMLPNYPQINRDVVLTGLFIHDLGKCAELTWEKGFDYTDEGRLIGHIARGSLWLQKKADDCAAVGHPIAEPLLNVLHHIILSHHGKAEFGALKPPSTPEAIFISLLDNLDAKMQMAIEAGRSEDTPANAGGHFTEKLWALENTRLFRPDPTTLD